MLTPMCRHTHTHTPVGALHTRACRSAHEVLRGDTKLLAPEETPEEVIRERQQRAKELAAVQDKLKGPAAGAGLLSGMRSEVHNAFHAFSNTVVGTIAGVPGLLIKLWLHTEPTESIASNPIDEWLRVVCVPVGGGCLMHVQARAAEALAAAATTRTATATVTGTGSGGGARHQVQQLAPRRVLAQSLLSV